VGAQNASPSPKDKGKTKEPAEDVEEEEDGDDDDDDDGEDEEEEEEEEEEEMEDVRVVAWSARLSLTPPLLASCRTSRQSTSCPTAPGAKR
jgi:hypothetical protein